MVDSSELAFKLAAAGAFKQAFPASDPGVLEPVMAVEVRVPTEFQGSVVADMAKRRGLVADSTQEADDAVLTVHVPLAEMFGYSTSLRSMTQVQGGRPRAGCYVLGVGRWFRALVGCGVGSTGVEHSLWRTWLGESALLPRAADAGQGRVHYGVPAPRSRAEGGASDAGG